MVKSLVIWVILVPWQSKQNGAAVDVSAEMASHSCFYWKKYDCTYRKTSNISRTLVGNTIVENSDVDGASPVGAAPTTSEFSA